MTFVQSKLILIVVELCFSLSNHLFLTATAIQMLDMALIPALIGVFFSWLKSQGDDPRTLHTSLVNPGDLAPGGEAGSPLSYSNR